MSKYSNDDVEMLIAQHEFMVQRGGRLVPDSWIEVQRRSAALLKELLERRAADAIAIDAINQMSNTGVDMVLLAGTRYTLKAIDQKYLPESAASAQGDN